MVYAMKPKRTILFRGAGILLAVILGASLIVAITFVEETKYCRLLFGPDADTQIVLGVKGKWLYLYRGSIPQGPSDTFRSKGDYWLRGTNVEIPDADGTTHYTITLIDITRDDEPGASDRLSVSVTVDGTIQCRQYCDVELRDASQELAVAHFHGPLTIGPQTFNWEIIKTPLVAGDKATDIRANVGTLNRARGCWTVVRSQNREESAFPEGVVPYVEIQFPPKTPDGPSVKQRFPLNEFC